MTKDAKLNARQARILEFIRSKKQAGNQEIVEFFKQSGETVSRYTIIRNIGSLFADGVVEKIGRGRSVVYREKETSDLLRFIDLNTYFAKGPDERSVRYPRFDGSVFSQFTQLFSQKELEKLTDSNATYREHMEKLSDSIRKKEFERLTVEFSWKSSHIEGNTYTLLDTERLLEDHEEAVGHSHEEAVMIINHKRALDYISGNKEKFVTPQLNDVLDIHTLVVAGMSVNTGIRKSPVGIIGTTYRPLDNEYQIRESLEKATTTIRGLQNPFSQALATILAVSYIQPFEDGNKRTARLLGNAILLAQDVCPLSFRSVDEGDYKKATIMFYEQHNARFFKELFIKQFEFAVEHYFLA